MNGIETLVKTLLKSFLALTAISLLYGCVPIMHVLNEMDKKNAPKEQKKVVVMNTGGVYCNYQGEFRRQSYVDNLIGWGWTIKSVSSSTYQARSGYVWHDGKPCSFTTYVLEK
jgi:hypothetical protein